MAATITELGARVLRRLGVVAVAAADRPSITATSSVTDIAGRALQSLGIIVTDAERPAISATVTVTDLAERALQTLGVIVPASARPSVGTATAADIAERALQNLGVVVPEADRPSNTATVTVTELAARALQALDVPVPASAWPTTALTVTVANIANEALVRLGVIASDETASASDSNIASVAVAYIHETLWRRGLVTWFDSAIPMGVAQDYALLTALHLATSFGKQADPAQRSVIEARIGWTALVARSQALAEARVQAIHAGLVAAGLATYLNSAIPASVAEPYVQMLIVELAPVFGKQADPGRLQQWEGMVRRDALTRRAQTDAVAIVASVHARLVALGIVDWTSAAIPASVAEDYAELIANDYRPLFGQPQDRSGEQIIEQRIRHQQTVTRAQAIAEAKITAIHEGLVAAGLVDWTISTIPKSVSEPYLLIARVDLGPVFGQQVAPDAIPAAEAQIKRVSTVRRAQALAEARADAIHEGLVVAGLAGWASTAIPRAISEDMVALVANEVAPILGGKTDPAMVAGFEQRVRRMSLIIAGPALAEQAVRAVHDDLAARGKTRWTLDTLWPAAERPYVFLAAFALAPEFAVPQNENDRAMATVDLARLIALPTSGERTVAVYF
jgi:hypothetical protein